jgi:hypothetical protein
MTHKFSLIVFFALALMGPQLAGCAELVPYPVKDSGMLTEEADLVWLDNQRVLFHGYKAVEQAKTAEEFPRYIDRGLYLWDTTTGSIELYDMFEQRKDGLQLKSPLCVHDGVLTYVNRGMVITGKRGEETKTPFPKPSHWFNPHSCRYSETKPFWLVEGHRSIPLLEEHGYLDLRTRPEPDYLTLRLEDPNPAIRFYSVEAKKSFPLPIGWLEVGFLQTHYAQFSSTYLLAGLQYYDDKRGFSSAWPDDVPLKVWWLSPDGQIKKEELPKLPWSHGNSFSFLPTRKGLLLIKQSPSGPQPLGAMGGYLVQGQEVKNVVAGALRKVVISPDGCTVAAVNDTYMKKPVNERMRLQIIELCQGE